MECSVDDCTATALSLTYCTKHYSRHRRNGYTDLKPIEQYQFKKPQGPVVGYKRKEDISYRGAHYRIEAVRGKAAWLNCVDCGGEAHEWSLQTKEGAYAELSGNDANKPYSLDIYDYQPRCRKCHRRFDGGDS